MTTSSGHGAAPSRASEDGSGLCPLPELALYRARGNDAVDFLSRQLSCDVAMLSATQSVHGAWLSPKGRVLALVRLIQRDDAIVLIMDKGVAEPAVKRMAMFVLRSDVRIEPAPDLAISGLIYPSRAGMSIPQLETQISGDAGRCWRWNSLTVVAVAADDSRVLLLGPEPDLTATHQSLAAAGAQSVAPESWQRLEVQAGVPSLDAANVDTFVPQMLNLDRIEGISFSKGCYPGQEIVARTQHLGRIKRRMFRARVRANEPVRPGSSLHTQAAPDTSVGRVVQVAPDPSGDTLLLAVVALAQAEANEPLFIGETAIEQLSEPPYGLSVST